MYSRIIALATTAVVLGTVPAALAAASSPASVFVVHGIPGRDVASTLDPLLPVDVSVSGICLLQGLDFGEIKGPFEIAAGTYAITVSLANTVSPCSNAAVISANVTVKAGETAAVVAALSPSGTPTAYPLGIDFHKLGMNDNRLFVAHADAPAVNITLDKKGRQIAGIKNLMPGMEFDSTVHDGNYEVTVYPTGSQMSVLRPLPLDLPGQGSTLVFAVGNAASGSLTLLTKTVPDVF